MSHPETNSTTNTPEQPVASRQRTTMMLLIIFLIVLAVLAVSGVVTRVHARSTLKTETRALAEPTVLIAPPTPGEPAQEIVLPGNVQAYVDSPVYARTSGYLQKWYFDIGAHVKKGQLLADIDSPEVDQQLSQAKEDLANAQATSANAQTTATRYQGLLESNAVSKQDTDNFTSQAAAATATVKAAQANVDRLQDLVSFEKVYAPFDGVITARNVDIGTLIDAGANKELFHMAAVQTLRVYVNVPQVYSEDATKGITADLTFNQYPGRRFQGKLVRTSNQIDPVSRTLLAEVDVDNRSGELLPGAYAEVHLKLNQQTQQATFMVPASTLIFRTDGLRVATVVNGDTAKLVPITIGQDNGTNVQVVSGLAPDSQVIQDPPDSLVDGEKVEVVKRPGRPVNGGGF